MCCLIHLNYCLFASLCFELSVHLYNIAMIEVYVNELMSFIHQCVLIDLVDTFEAMNQVYENE